MLIVFFDFFYFMFSRLFSSNFAILTRFFFRDIKLKLIIFGWCFFTDVLKCFTTFFSASRSFCVQNSVLISFFSLFPLKYFFVAAVYSFFLLSICKLRDAFISRNFIWPVLFCKVLVCSIFGLIIKRITLFFKNSPTQF